MRSLIRAKPKPLRGEVQVLVDARKDATQAAVSFFDSANCTSAIAIAVRPVCWP